MNEEIVLRVLAEQGIDLVASLPCDKNKRLTALLPTKFPVIDLAREEDISRRQAARDVDSELRPWEYAERTDVAFTGV